MTMLAALLLYGLVVAAAEAIPAIRAARTRRYLPRDQRWDSTEAEVAEWGALLLAMPDRPLNEPPLDETTRRRALLYPTGPLPTVPADYPGAGRPPRPAPVRWARWETPREGMPLVLTGQGVVR